MIQILGISTLAKIPENELFTEKRSNQNIKEQLTLFTDNELCMGLY